MEKIYIVKHYNWNGEQYPQDEYDYTEYKLFSTLEKAEAYYSKELFGDYYGRYTLIEFELDTQNKVILEESPFGKYIMQYEDYEDDEPNDDYWNWLYDNYEFCYGPYDPDNIWKEKEEDDYRNDWEDADDWLDHNRDNYDLFEEIRKDRERRLLESLNKDLDELLNL